MQSSIAPTQSLRVQVLTIQFIRYSQSVHGRNQALIAELSARSEIINVLQHMIADLERKNTDLERKNTDLVGEVKEYEVEFIKSIAFGSSENHESTPLVQKKTYYCCCVIL